jgi:hypothetical protein
MPRVTAIVSRSTNRVSLVQGHEYEVIGIDDTHFRIVDECGEPALYPKSFFVDCEISPPDDWEYQDFGDGEFTINPREFSSNGFYEDYADARAAAVEAFKDYIQQKGLLIRRELTGIGTVPPVK